MKWHQTQANIYEEPLSPNEYIPRKIPHNPFVDAVGNTMLKNTWPRSYW